MTWKLLTKFKNWIWIPYVKICELQLLSNLRISSVFGRYKIISIRTFKVKFRIENALFKAILPAFPKKESFYNLSITELYSIIFWVLKEIILLYGDKCMGYKRDILIRYKCYSYSLSFSALIKIISNYFSDECYFEGFKKSLA